MFLSPLFYFFIFKLADNTGELKKLNGQPPSKEPLYKPRHKD